LPDSPRRDDRKGGFGAIISGKGQGEQERPLTTEKMLSANARMSNIFLQRGQNIDIAHKNE
jgi:hypothetical protein